MKSLFLSHSHSDKKFVRKLAKDLRNRGVYVWVDEAEIKVGDSLIQRIREGIDKVDYVGVILSQASVESEWVAKEIDVAMNQEIEGKRVKVLPIVIETCDLPSFLIGKLYADFRNSYAGGLRSLISRLEVNKLLSPHKPVVKSFEISIQAQLSDQVPQIAQRDERIFTQWVERKETHTIIYIYTLDAARFHLLNSSFYTIPSQISEHWLIATSTTVVSFVQLDNNKEVWCTDLFKFDSLVPFKHFSPNSSISSLVSNAVGFLISTWSAHELNIVQVNSDGLIQMKKTKEVSSWICNSTLISFPDRVGILLQTLRGIEISFINKSFEIQAPKILVPGLQPATTIIDVGIMFYDNCAKVVGEEVFVVYFRRKKVGQNIEICIISAQGEISKSTVLVSNDDPKLHFFKPSLGLGKNSIIVLWHQSYTGDYRPKDRTLLCCMLFDKQTFKPLIPYPRTLTSTANCMTGVPVILNNERYYIVYQEDALDQFKIKLSEIEIGD